MSCGHAWAERPAATRPDAKQSRSHIDPGANVFEPAKLLASACVLLKPSHSQGKFMPARMRSVARRPARQAHSPASVKSLMSWVNFP